MSSEKGDGKSSCLHTAVKGQNGPKMCTPEKVEQKHKASKQLNWRSQP